MPKWRQVRVMLPSWASHQSNHFSRTLVWSESSLRLSLPRRRGVPAGDPEVPHRVVPEGGAGVDEEDDGCGGRLITTVLAEASLQLLMRVRNRSF